MLPTPYWQDMTTEDFHGLDPERTIAVLPIAAIEQHGPHLPVATDHAIAQACIERVVALLPDDLGVTFLPIQSVGKSNEHISSPGTLTLSWDTVTRAWIELGESVNRAGVKKLMIITSHGGNVPIMDIVARELRVRHEMLAVSTAWARFGQPEDLFPAHESTYGIHGGDVETSIMLAARPDLVKMEKAIDFKSTQLSFLQEFKHLRAHGPSQFGWKAQDLNVAGTVGDASNADADKGRKSIDHSARAFIDLCRDMEAFSLDRLWAPD